MTLGVDNSKHHHFPYRLLRAHLVKPVLFSLRPFPRHGNRTLRAEEKKIHSSMLVTEAFIAPIASPAAFSVSKSSRPLVQEGKHSKPPCVSRRRLRACASTPPSDSSQSESQPQEKEGSETDPDDDASDLALPSLKEIFAGAGRPGCSQCDGKGEISCPVCNGKGYLSLVMMDTTSSTQCRMCRGSRSVPCPTCRDVVYKSVVWWDQTPSEEEDPEGKWREGPDGNPRISWTEPPAGS